MSSINGYDNEYEFVKKINGKLICELDPMTYDLIKYLYPKESENSIIRCWRNHYFQKSDLLIKVNGQIKGVSIKKGSKNSVHVEAISEFIHFLIENHISRESVIEFLKYHYADGTTNGKGQVRLSSKEYKKDHQPQMDKINQELQNKNIIKKAVERFVLKGNNSFYSISALIYGEANDFLWITKEDIIDIFLRKFKDYSSSIHFGPLIVQPKNRCLNNNLLYNKDRYCVQLKWYSLFDDIIEQLYLKETKPSAINVS